MDKKSNIVKNQHYVPRMLLKGFREPESENQISIYNFKSNKIISEASISDQCSKKYYYGKDGVMEKHLGDLEGSTATAIREICSSERLPQFGTKEWLDLNLFFVVQYGRTPGAFNLFKQRINSMKEQAIKLSLGYEIDVSDQIEEKFRITEDALLVNLALNIESEPIIRDLSTILVINDSEFDFIISDIGIVTYNQWTLGGYGQGTDGLASQGLMLILPITSKYLLVKYDPEVYSIHGLRDGVLHIHQNYRIKQLNEIQLIFAEQNVYFNGASNQVNWLIKNAKNITRSPRSTSIRTDRFLSKDGTGLLHTYTEQPKCLRPFDWVLINPKFRSIPKHERASMYRETAIEMQEAISDSNQLSDTSILGKTFKLVED